MRGAPTLRAPFVQRGGEKSPISHLHNHYIHLKTSTRWRESLFHACTHYLAAPHFSTLARAPFLQLGDTRCLPGYWQSAPPLLTFFLSYLRPCELRNLSPFFCDMAENAFNIFDSGNREHIKGSVRSILGRVQQSKCTLGKCIA